MTGLPVRIPACPAPASPATPTHCRHWEWEGRPCCWCGADEDCDDTCPALLPDA